jgi:HPt (histidine-containing phosphotransfer) domain-containing protein
MKGDRERFLAAGMDGYVSKPIRPGELHEAVEGPAPAGSAEGMGRGEGEGAASAGGAGARIGAAPATPGDAVLDWEGALERAGGSARIRARLVEVFLKEGPALVASIRDAIGKGDVESLRRHAHTLGGSLDLFGAAAARATAGRLEEGATGGSEALAEELEAQVAAVTRELRARAGGTP